MGNSSGRMNNKTTAEQAALDIDLNGKIIIVTGGNSGIGKETVRVLAKHNATVILPCRSLERGNEAKKDIVADLKESNPNFDENKLKVMILDLASLKSVKEFAINFTKEYNQLHYLIANAGVMAGGYDTTTDGYEITFGSNHLGHFYLTLLLTNVLKQTKPSRVVVLSSDLLGQAPNPFINVVKGYIEKSNGPVKQRNNTAMENYCISKACNMLFAREYNRRYQSQGITCVSLHPGVIATNLSRNLPNWMKVVFSIGRAFLKSVEQGAATTVRCCSLKDNEIQGGHYYRDCNDVTAQLPRQFRIDGDYNTFTDEQIKNDQAYLLWQLSEKLITQKNFTFNLNDNSNEEQKSNDVNVNANVATSTSTSAAVTTTTSTKSVDNATNVNDNNNYGNQTIEEQQ